MRIGVLGLRGLPGVSGGIETHCEHLIGHLARQRAGDEITVFGRRRYLAAEPGAHHGARVVALWHAKSAKLETLSSSLAALLHARFALQADVVHIHGICSALLSPLARLLGMRVVVTHHGCDYKRQKWNRLERSLLQAGEWCGATWADRIIAVSPTIARDLSERYPHAQVRAIPNGADHLAAIRVEPGLADAVIRKHGLEDGPFAISVGRLDPDKGFDDLIAAHAESGWTGKLVIVGDDPRQSPYARGLLAKASPRLVFTGFLPATEIAALLSRASLFVMPSHQEGFPIAALEAAMAGTPLLLSDLPATRDLGLPERHYFPVGDIQGLARKLGEPHRSFALADRTGLEKYNWAAVAAATSAVYDEVIAKTRRQARLHAWPAPGHRAHVKTGRG